MNTKASRKTIFQLERRVDLYEEYMDLTSDLKETKSKTTEYSGKSIMRIISDAMRTWPFREGDSTISGYLDKRGIELDISREEADPLECDILYTLELYLNLLYWAVEYDTKKPSSWSIKLGEISLFHDINPIIENILYVLERCNYSLRKTETDVGFPQYVLTKRNAAVDAAIRHIPELAEVLLSYYDLRNQKDETAKKSILLSLYAYLEPRRKEYKGTGYGDLYDKVFCVFNKFKIRHNDKDQISLSKKQRMELMDMTFDMCVHLLMLPSVSNYKTTVDNYMVK